MSPDRYPTVSTDSAGTRFSRTQKRSHDTLGYARVRQIMREDQPPVTPRKAVGAPTPSHRADQDAFRKLQPIREKAEAIVRKDGGNADVVAAQLALLARVAAKRETTDNIGRAVV